VQNQDLKAVFNFEQVTEWLGTSGQPSADEFQSIAEAGYDAVINLALPTSDNAIPNEGSLVTGYGMRYFHLPVKMEEPTLDDLRTFFGLMRALEGKKVWVHCVVNARVSAFVYHYLRFEKGLDDAAARTRLLTRWEPQMDRVWRDFLAIPKASIQK
jgi:protein tyrosine phosphatase (PTP) superfamily phosphohydrolase (DUF442 family)